MDIQYYRTFIGIPVLAGKELLKVRVNLMNSLAGERISWVDPERYHVTLRFVGETDVSKITHITESLHQEISVLPPSRIQLTRPESFGPKQYPRVIWVGFHQSELFRILKADVDRALEKCGIPLVDQPFRAHLTLGRVRKLENLPMYYEALERMKNQLSESVLIDRVVFYRSVPGEGEPVYTTLH